ncbi:MAG: tRNA pseudouridine(55) synthase TruB [Bacteroidetes bacterium]|nr:tRNA pseudouridine(55) synthase TruB [Bacteroidota bacterium]
MSQSDYLTGKVVLINKPLHWTSFNAVYKVKFTVKQYLSPETYINHTPGVISTQKKEKFKLKVGHAGTLDPLATGLLIICTGKETKNIDKYQAEEKEYTGTFVLGATTPCYDLEKEIDQYYPTDHITKEMIQETAKKFTGTFEQVPPIFSAIRINGRRAYKIARAGKTAEIKAKEITISEFEITRISLPEVDFRIVCSKGTYIRSLARDFGEELNSGAHLSALCRTRIGNFKLADAMTIEEFVNSFQ